MPDLKFNFERTLAEVLTYIGYDLFSSLSRPFFLIRLKMAAIIAQITRANRERIDRKGYDITIQKCMYEIRPFERTYDPTVRFSILFFSFLVIKNEIFVIF